MEQQTIDNLKSLKTLLDSGVLTAEEYEKEKKNILCERDNNVSPNQANFRELIVRGDYFWYSNPSLKTIYFLLNIVECASSILPTIAIKNKKYRLTSIIVIGLLTIYYIFQNFQNIMS